MSVLKILAFRRTDAFYPSRRCHHHHFRVDPGVPHPCSLLGDCRQAQAYSVLHWSVSDNLCRSRIVLILALSPAPTAIRLLRRLGEHHVKGHDLSSLRTIGSVGEPINPEVRKLQLTLAKTALLTLYSQAWEWYWEHVGNKECAVVDTYWQTETGSIIIT